MNKQPQSVKRSRSAQADRLRAESPERAEPRWHGTEVERAMTLHAAASRILWAYASNERESAGVEN